MTFYELNLCWYSSDSIVTVANIISGSRCHKGQVKKPTLEYYNVLTNRQLLLPLSVFCSAATEFV